MGGGEWIEREKNMEVGGENNNREEVKEKKEGERRKERTKTKDGDCLRCTGGRRKESRGREETSNGWRRNKESGVRVRE